MWQKLNKNYKQVRVELLVIYPEMIMKGAKEYAELFEKSQQHGRLYLQVGEHARGKTFRIWILPNDDKLTESIHTVKDAVEVYGVTGGQPGWTETYGWLHKGSWQQDFERLVNSKKLEKEADRKKNQALCEESEKEKQDKVKALLEAY